VHVDIWGMHSSLLTAGGLIGLLPLVDNQICAHPRDIYLDIDISRRHLEYIYTGIHLWEICVKIKGFYIL